IGFAIWTNPSKTRLVRRTLWEWILFWVVHPIQDFFGVDLGPGLPVLAKRLLEEQYEIVFGKGGVAERLGKPWHLHLCAVHPSWQNAGVGTKLIHWGLEKAEKDKAPVYLESE